MEREQVELEAPGLDRRGTLIRYGHFGRPVLVFPSEQGRAWDYENNGMVDAVAPLIELYALITSHACDSVTAFSNASR